MSLKAIVKRIFRGPSPRPIPTHLSEAQAIGLARDGAVDHWLRDSLKIATVHRNANGAAIWTVESSGVGASLRVVIDDASGQVLERVAREGR